jgi:glucose-6-phosphate isomerase
VKIKLFNISKKILKSPTALAEFEKFNAGADVAALTWSTNVQEVENFARANKKWKHVLIIGIGGSSLPAQTLVEALQKAGAGVPAKRGTWSTQFHFLDNLDPHRASRIFKQVSWKQTLVIVIAKSGETLETLANFFVVKKLLGSSWRKQVVVVTDPKQGFLRELAEKEKLTTFAIPPEIGGRFSVFSNVGLLPAALAGIDIKKLIAGAKKANVKKAFQLAQIQAREYKRGKNIATLCAYSNALESFAKWWEQLLGESIGKSSKIGITPQLAIGATDQHSKLQLWHDGPNDKFFIFLNVEKMSEDFHIPNPPKDFAFLKNKSMQQILNVERQATIKSLVEKKRSIITQELPKLDEESLGELLQFWMLEVYFLGKILGINPFNQPGVEKGKILTKKLLI